MSRMTRREAVGTLIKGSLVATLIDLAQGGHAMAEGAQPSTSTTLQLPPSYQGEHQVKPLPFDATKLKGLSEKLISSHHQNNYGGAVRRLNQIQQQIGSLPKDAAPYQMGSLKREELIATNSMILHEFYFGNLGGDGKASGTIVDLIKSQYGSVETWEHDFRLTGMSLAGGSGWVILNYNPRENATPTGPRIIRTALPGASHSWSWICTSIPITWTTGPMPTGISTRFSRTSTGMKSTAGLKTRVHESNVRDQCSWGKVGIVMKSIITTILAVLFAGSMVTQGHAMNTVTLDFETFEVGKSPAGFSIALTGGGGPVVWVIQEDPTAPNGSKVLAQMSADGTSYRFPLCVYDNFTAKDVMISVKFKPVSGKIDQTAGIVWRYQDKDNYYIVRANALENNVVLYKVENGKRIDLKPTGAGLFAYGKKANVPQGQWSELRVAAKGDRFEVSVNGESLFAVEDNTFTEAGKVGLWTKADSVTFFDELRITGDDAK